MILDKLDQDIEDIEEDVIISGGATCDVVHHRLHGRVICPKNVDDLFKILKKFSYLSNRFKDSRGIIWRGQKDLDWRIDSALVREARNLNFFDPNCSNEELKKRVKKLEYQYLEEAKMSGFHIWKNQTLEDIELLALLQHHGGQTRMLDFSYNFFVSLWFAIGGEFHTLDKSFDATGKIQVTRNTNYNLVLGVGLTKENSHNLEYSDRKLSFEEIFEKNGRDKIFLYKSHSLLERMRVQQSLFVFSEITTSKNHSLVCDFNSEKWLNSPKEVEGGMVAIGVSDSLRIDLFSSKFFQNIMGISNQYLFPEIDSFAKSYEFRAVAKSSLSGFDVEID